MADSYINEHIDEIAACCAYNNVPCEPTGEIFDRIGIRWRTYEFARQFDAIRFWAKFEGRWMDGRQRFSLSAAAEGLAVDGVVAASWF